MQVSSPTNGLKGALADDLDIETLPPTKHLSPNHRDPIIPSGSVFKAGNFPETSSGLSSGIEAYAIS